MYSSFVFHILLQCCFETKSAQHAKPHLLKAVQVGPQDHEYCRSPLQGHTAARLINEDDGDVVTVSPSWRLNARIARRNLLGYARLTQRLNNVFAICSGHCDTDFSQDKTFFMTACRMASKLFHLTGKLAIIPAKAKVQ
jgi:hypothetical protein